MACQCAIEEEIQCATGMVWDVASGHRMLCQCVCV